MGIVVNDLNNLDKVLDQVSKEEYGLISKKVRDISLKLRNGDFGFTALKKALKILNKA